MLRVLKILSMLYLGLLISILFSVGDESHIAQMVFLIIIFVLGFKSLKWDSLASRAKKEWVQSATQTALIQKVRQFNIVFVFSPIIYTITRRLDFSPEALIGWTLILSVIVGVFYDKAKFIGESILAIKRWFYSIDVDKFARASEVFGYFDKLNKLKQKEKAEKIQELLPIINDTLDALVDADERYKRLRLGGSDFIFTDKCFQQLLKDIELCIRQKDRVAKKAAFSNFSHLGLSEPELEDLFLHQEEIQRYFFGTDEYYIHNVNLAQFMFCSCCGLAKVKKDEDESEGEYFCSDLCEEIEALCLKISDEINPQFLNGETYEEYQQRRQGAMLSDSTAAAITALGSAGTWAKNYAILQNTNTGHGLAAEIMNHENEGYGFKRFTGKAQIIGGDNAKNGADRLVDGLEIQTKYYKTAARSVGSAFNNKGDGNYRYFDKNGKPMTLEVPKDQYDKAVQVMEEKIKEGKVPGVKDPNEARNIIKKGSVTYQEAKNYSKFCTKESLKFDARNGAIVAVGAFGVSFVFNTALCFFRGKDAKEALRESFVIGCKTGGKSFVTFMIGAQMQRIPQVNYFLKEVIKFEFKSKMGQKISANLARAAGKGAVTKGAQVSAANSAIRGTVVAASAAMIASSGWEMVQMMRGQISGMQCVKNIAVNSGGIAGGAAGALAGAAALSFIPGVGTIAGGLLGGLVGGMGGGSIIKKIMDNFIEDDLLKKQRIFYAQMVLLSVSFKLTNEEANIFRAAVDEMISKDKDFFGKKFSVKNILPYSNQILKPIVVVIVSRRKKLPPNIFDEEIVVEVIEEEIKESVETDENAENIESKSEVA